MIIPAIVGPTASGKSDLGINLALHFDAEIINLDSVQVYRGIYVATAKVAFEEQCGIPHHLIDIVEPTENFTAGEYARIAMPIIHDIAGRGKIEILVGGSGFYLRALMNPIFEAPPTDLQLRARLMNLRDRKGAEYLHKILRRKDPPAAAAVSPADWSRAMRALEFYLQTGRRISEAQKDLPPAPELARQIRILALNPPRSLLYEKINRRAEIMFDQGLIAEVQALLASGSPAHAQAFQA